MCTSPVKILNPSRWLSHEAGQQLYLYVPCGHCFECRQKLQNEWRIRTYYECLDTIGSGGYVLFDTLTYAPEWLPRLSDFVETDFDTDFSCFRSKDIQDFMKRLRTGLSRPKKDEKTKCVLRPAYDVKDNLRYFVVSEYGKQRTLRPHYHIFLFVRNSCIPPDILSAAIAEYWKFGRTDGVPFKGRNYVLSHCRFDSMDVATKRCVLYVSKYVAKDFQYCDMVRRRLKILCERRFGDNQEIFSNRVARSYYQMLSKFVCPFHRQSLGYGGKYIELQMDNIMQSGVLKFNFNGVPLTLGLFPSLKRKLFYNKYRNSEGDYRWFLNNRGILFKASRADRQVLDLQQQVNEYNLCHDKKLTFDVRYFLFNHDRLQKTLFVPVQSQLVSSSSVHEFNGYRNYSSIDRDFIHRSILTKRDFGSRKHGFSTLNKLNQVKDISHMSDNSFIDLKDFQSYALFDSDVEFQYNLLLDWLKLRGCYKLKTKRLLERNKKILKSLNLC